MPQTGWPYPQTNKPPRGASIDPTHPWASGLKGLYALNEGTGPTCCDSGPGRLALSALGFGAASPWGVGPNGQGLSLSAAGRGMQAVVPASLQSGLPLTIAVAFRALGAPSASGIFAEISYGSSNVSPYIVLNLQYNASSGYLFGWNAAGTQASIQTTTPAPTAGLSHVLAGLLTASGAQLWLDGARIASTAAAISSPTWTAGSTFFFGSFSGYTSTTPDALIHWGGWWNRSFAAAELAALTGSPGAIWAMYAPGPTRSIFFLGALSVYTATASGGIVAGGTAAGSPAFTPSASGGIVAGGVAGETSAFVASASGGIVAGGTAGSSSTFVAIASGGIVAGGVAVAEVSGGTYPGIDVIAATLAWWDGTPSMVALTSDGRLWHRAAPEGTQLPYATVALASERAETWTTDYPFERSGLVISPHAATSLLARSLGKSIRAAFRGAPLAIGGSPVCHVLPDGASIAIAAGLAPAGRDCWVAAETFDICWTP